MDSMNYTPIIVDGVDVLIELLLLANRMALTAPDALNKALVCVYTSSACFDNPDDMDSISKISKIYRSLSLDITKDLRRIAREIYYNDLAPIDGILEINDMKAAVNTYFELRAKEEEIDPEVAAEVDEMLREVQEELDEESKAIDA